jgi:hypothetical protein
MPPLFKAQNGLEIHQNKKHGAALRYPGGAAWMPRCPIEGCELCRWCLAADCDEVVISVEVIASVRTP